MGVEGVLTPWKYVGGVRVCFDPPPFTKMSHFFIQNCCWITLQVSHHERWKTCVQIEGKTNFSRRPKQFDGLTWLPWPPDFTTDLRHCDGTGGAVRWADCMLCHKRIPNSQTVISVSACICCDSAHQFCTTATWYFLSNIDFNVQCS